MRIIKIVLCFALIFALHMLFACNGQQKVYNIGTKACWLEHNPEADVGNVDENNVYDVKFLKNSDIPDNKNKSDEKDDDTITGEVTGTFTTRLTKDGYDGKPCYKFETVLKTNGYYEAYEIKYSVNDEITSVVYFSGINGYFFPLHSEKKVLSTYPGTDYLDEKTVRFGRLKYEIETMYDENEKSATVKITDTSSIADDSEEKDKSGETGKPDDGGEPAPKSPGFESLFNGKTSTEQTYRKLGSDYFDNESMILIPRTCELEQGFMKSFKSLDALSGALNTIQLSVPNDTPIGKRAILDGSELNVWRVTMSLTGTFAGNPLELEYASDKKKLSNLVWMRTYLPYSLGAFEYTLRPAN